MTTYWRIDSKQDFHAQRTQAEVLKIEDCATICSDRWFWDFAPVVDDQGKTYVANGRECWLALTALKSSDPDERHFNASLSVLHRHHNRWSYVKDLPLRGMHPGNREWAGMAVVSNSTMRTYFTSAGCSELGHRGYQQRLWAASVAASYLLDPNGEAQWFDVAELIRAEDGPYLPAYQETGEPGRIRAFRDPFEFGLTGKSSRFIVFTATSREVPSTYNGAIGLAEWNESSRDWEHRGPLVLSDDLAIELERPHVVQFDGLIYLFWSSPQYVFNPDVSAPTGLYGAVSEGIDGEFELLNSTGLVISNPAECPSQVYSWHVANDLTVQGFVDQVVVSESGDSNAFVGTAAPRLRLHLDGSKATVNSKLP